jgi:hypothetical protein
MYRLETAGARELARAVETLRVMSHGLLPHLEHRLAESPRSKRR